MNTIDLLNAAGIRKMTVLADENGVAIRLPRSEAALMALKVEGATLARDNFHGVSGALAKYLTRKTGKKVHADAPQFYIRVRL